MIIFPQVFHRDYLLAARFRLAIISTRQLRWRLVIKEKSNEVFYIALHPDVWLFVV